ncbi:hypothetical protein QI633_11290 [Nocardioides sp. QY071]|uniref:hypothetical protein n=1 Tax=Nocardioides sp. QY071 TaxID=3044187 RepID=UPI00249BA406|nr:hypothetical protein [Nocardioides sp. QY071]WGY04330.1 hypothetical protein QI633_11290 [Nocardioides sp. QY071]
MTNVLLWVTAISTLGTGIATVGLVVVAQRTFGGAADQLRLLQEQAQRDSRPYVTVRAVPGLHGAGFWDLVVENFGKSAAYEVTVDAGPITPRDANDHISERLADYLATPRTLVPGARERVMWRSEDAPSMGVTESGAPAAVTCRLSYRNEQLDQFEETYPLDLMGYGAVVPMPTEGPRASGTGKELANIEKALRTLNVHVGELRH